jgi:hypothetical protein
VPRRFRTFAFVAVPLLAVTTVVAVEAGAITSVVDSESLADNSQNSDDASCPAGQRVIGGGVFINTPYGQAALVGTRPGDGDDADSKRDDGWEGIADSGDVTTPNDEFDIEAICQGGKAGRSLRYSKKDATLDPTSRKTKVARCPDEYKAIGGGVSAEGVFNSTEAEVSRPIKGLRGWEGRTNNVGASASGMTVYAICATGRFARDVVYRSERSATLTSGLQGQISAECPAGSEVIGGGVLTEPAATLVATHSGPGAWTSRVDATGGNTIFRSYAFCHK